MGFGHASRNAPKIDLELQKLTAENSQEDREKRTVLLKILNFFKTHVNALGDEIDLLLRADLEVNIPTGGKTMLTPTRIDLVRAIFTHLALNKELGIQEETQGLRSEEELHNIFKGLARVIVNHPGLCLQRASSDIKEAFYEFLVADKDVPIPKTFSKYVDHLKKSTWEKDREASELIPLARHIIADILPKILKQSPGLHFGRADQASSPGKIVPYIGVDTPSNREFGYHYEALCKHFFTAIVQKLEPKQLASLFVRFISEAKREMMVNKCTLQTTATAKEFKELTGQDLSQFRLDKDLDNVTAYLQADISKLLRIEAETAFEYVGFHPEYYHSSAQALPNLISSPLKGMTGTPWNSDGYHLDLQKLFPDIGAEGQILYTLLDREKRTHIHTVEHLQLKHLMKKLKDMEKFPSAILDMGALFKEHSIETTAREYLCAALEKKVANKKAVLFFHRQPGEQTADRLAIGRFVKDRWSVELLTNTREDSLSAKGLCPKQCLVFFDQRHTTGTDISLPLQTHAVITASEIIETRTLLQTVMRLRKFCSSQTADFLLYQNFYAQLKQGNNQVSIKDLLSLACKNLALKKANSLFSSFKQQIDEVFIEKYRQHMRRDNVNPLILKTYGPLIRSQLCDQPYQQFFNDSKMKNPIEVLKAYQKHQLETFNRQRQKHSAESLLEQDYKELNSLTSDVIEQAKNKKANLLLLIPNRQNLQGTEVEIQQEQDIQVEQEQEISQELINELQRYQQQPQTPKAQHQPWWDIKNPQLSIQQFIHAIHNQDQPHPAGLLPAPKIFEKTPYSSGRHFDQIFPDTIKLTAAMQRSYKTFLPIFHPSQKIAESILVVESKKGPTFVILSSGEASLFLKHTQEIKDVWLVNSSGKPYAKTSSALDLSQREDICEGLVMVNLFLGRASAIEDIPEGMLYVQMWIEGGQGNENDRKDYLTLRSLNRPAVDQVSRFTKIMAPQMVQGVLKAQSFSKDDIQKLEKPKEIFRLNNDQIQHISPRHVPFIQNRLISSLTQPDLIQAVPIKKLAHLTNVQAQHLTKNQALFLQAPELIKNLPQKIIEKITLRDLLTHKNLTHLLTHQQIQWVKEKSPSTKLLLEDWRKQGAQSLKNLSIFLPEKDLSLLEPKEVICVNYSLLKHLAQDQLQHLTQNQVMELDETQIKHLPAGEVIQLLADHQVHYLEKREQIEHILPDQVAFLATKQLKHLKGAQIERVSVIKTAIWLNSSQFKDMNRLQQITLLVTRLLAFLAVTIAAVTARKLYSAPSIPKSTL